MERKTVSGIMQTLLLIALLTLVFNIQPAKAEPTTIIVPDNYPTIKEAIRAAGSGDTIIVKEGLYAEGLIFVNKPLTLIADGRVKVDGLHSGFSVFLVTASGVVIEGFTVKNALYGGISLWQVDDCKIEANTIINNHVGISIEGCNNRVIGNILSNNTLGISLSGMFFTTYRNVLEQNILRNNTVGIQISYSSYNIIRENTAANNEKGGIMLWFSQYNTVKENTVANNDELGIAIVVSHNNLVRENTATNNGDGIALAGSGWNTVEQNKVKRNTLYGIASFSSYACNTIKENVALGNKEFDLYWNGEGYNTWTENKYKTKTNNIVQVED